MCPRGVATSQSTSGKQTITSKLWLLLVGVNQYQDKRIPPLRYSAVDCQILAEALAGATQEQFLQKEVKIYHDFAQEFSLLATVRTTLQQITAAAAPLDTILFYFSGHGMLQPQNQQAFLCLADTQKDDLPNTALAVQELLQLLGNSRAQNQLVWLDACHSGGMTLRGMNPTPQLVEVLQQRAAKSKGFYALLSCDTEQQSWEFPELGHGVFTYYLMRGLQGDAADVQGLISADGLYRYVYYQTLQYIDKTNQQLRLINQQKRGKGDTHLFSEYPLQTPKRIVEGVGELILGNIPAIPEFRPPRTALVIEGISGSQKTLDFSKMLASVAAFDLQYLPRSRTTTVKDIRAAIQECLRSLSQQQRQRTEEPATVLLYLRGRLAQTPTGEAAFVLLEDIWLGRSWLKKQLRRSQVAQQIIILDCPVVDARFMASLQEWVEDLQLGSETGQCIIAANSPKVNPEQFAQALTDTLNAAAKPAGLSVAGWISQLQVYLAGALNLHIWLSGTQGVIEIIPPTTGGRSNKAALDLKICPYRGLRAFGEEDAQYFYGRETLTRQLISQLGQKSFLAVVGASGSGKSSVVHGGLIAQLRLGKQLPGSDSWWMKSLCPGTRPLDALARRLAGEGKGENLAPHLLLEGMLYQGVEGFVYWIRSRPEPMVVLVIDQFEELFTLAPSEDRQRFLELVLGAVEYAPDKFKLVMTLRADFIAACLEVSALARWLQQSSVLVPPNLSDEDYRRVIVNPAEQVGLKVEPGLVEVLLQELNHSAGDLPLLEFVLEQLWEFRQGGELTLFAYQQQVGGIKGALERKAQAVYDGLDSQTQDCARWIFLSLTQLGEGTEDTRRRVFKSELVVQRYPALLVERTLQALTAGKLVVVNLDEAVGSVKGEEVSLIASSSVVTIEVVHEILIRHWSTLRWWLEENRSRLRSQRQVEQAAALWKHNDEQADFLLSGIRLGEAEEIYVKYTDELSQDVQHFIAACLEARQRQQFEQKKRLRQAQRAIAVISILGIIASGFGGLAYFQKQSAQLREVAALNASSEALLLSNQQLEALIASVKSGRELKQVFAPPKDIQFATAASFQQAVTQTQEFNRLQGHNQQVNAVSFSHDGRFIASASDDQTVKIWNSSGQLFTTFPGFKNRVISVAFSPDGKFIAASADNTIQVFGNDIGLGEKFFLTNRQERQERQDNKEGGTFKTNSRLVKSLSEHTDIVTDISFSHDGNILASSSLDHTVKLWRIDGTLINSWNADNGWVNTVCFSPDGQVIASGGEDNVVKLWQASNGKLITSLVGHKGRITRIKFSPDGKYIASASGDKTIKLWNADGKLLQTLESHSEQVNSISFSPDNQFLASAAADNTIKLWRLNGSLLATLKGHGEQVRDVSFSQDGKILASASADKTIKLWQVPNNELLEGNVNSVGFNTDGKIFASAGWDGNITIRRRDKLTNLQKFKGHPDIINAVIFSQNGKYLATASADKTIKVWNSQNFQLIKIFTGHNNRVTSISFSPDSRILASASADKTIKLWRIADGTLLQTLIGHIDEVTTVSFSPDGKSLASGSADNTVKLWRIDGMLLKNFTGHNLAIASVKFSPDGKTLASASWDNTIKLWNVTTGQLINTLAGHSDGVTGLSFSPDGQILASGSADNTIKLWNTPTGTLLKTLLGHPHRVNSLSFSPDGKLLLSGGKDAGVMLWDLDLDDLMQRGCARLTDYLQNNPNVKEDERHICDR
ncbi:WD40 repeat-containing protein [Cylindrospermum stagnale PCC 7417]|uniref:WD40 repeat-containing protein n=1 Tax=Cylindrospermum stagnale PCC 7417 TaxID=56107 RepID=K9WUR9_9NOST|nr:caspase family protein [Cylindrospermum stagnale]AFZ24105.1 WD40 repeat-containing protein [Cylindrospermum stagnale PCC 7417]